MKTKKLETVITKLKDQIGHPLKRNLTELATRVNNFKRFNFVLIVFIAAKNMSCIQINQ